MAQALTDELFHMEAQHYEFPFANSPDIIRSNQKDILIQRLLLQKISDVLKIFVGWRTAHVFDTEVSVLSDLAYFGVTTIIGNRTLGEEYCDLVQVESDTRQLPSLFRRSTYVLSSILLPHMFDKLLSAVRLSSLGVRSDLNEGQTTTRGSDTLSSSRFRASKTLLSLMTSAPLYTISLAMFYFTGSYYHLSKFITRLRYIFTKTQPPSASHLGYEVLGFLLLLQMTIRGLLFVRSNFVRNEEVDSPKALQAMTNGAVSYRGYETMYDAEKSIYHLDDHTTFGWIEGGQKKCTLCLDEMTDPSVATCGHIFCWTCISNWIREKPECPLCRQSIRRQHLLALRS